MKKIAHICRGRCNNYADLFPGETVTCAVDSWTTCEELANLAVHNHGVDNSGWTITLWNQLDGPDAIVTETNGFDYVLDLISELELAPAFPAAKHMFLEQRKNSFPPIKKREVSFQCSFTRYSIHHRWNATDRGGYNKILAGLFSTRT